MHAFKLHFSSHCKFKGRKEGSLKQLRRGGEELTKKGNQNPSNTEGIVKKKQ